MEYLVKSLGKLDCYLEEKSWSLISNRILVDLRHKFKDRVVPHRKKCKLFFVILGGEDFITGSSNLYNKGRERFDCSKNGLFRERLGDSVG